MLESSCILPLEPGANDTRDGQSRISVDRAEKEVDKQDEGCTEQSARHLALRIIGRARRALALLAIPTKIGIDVDQGLDHRGVRIREGLKQAFAVLYNIVPRQDHEAVE